MFTAISDRLAENLSYGGVGFLVGSVTTYLILKTQGYHIRWVLHEKRPRGSGC